MGEYRRFIRLGALLWVICGLTACATPEPTATPSPTPTPTPGSFSLSVLYTNDGWGYTEPCACDPSVGGLARRAAYIRAVRQEQGNVLVVDAGDSLLTLQRVGDLEQGKLLAEAHNRMGYDAVALGGMDLRMGLDVLRAQIQVAQFAVLSANTLDPLTGDVFDKAYTVVERGGRRIALIGLTDPQMAVEVTGGEVRVTEPVQTLMDVVAKMHEDADVIIVLSHLGMLFDANLGRVVPEIDLIVSGRDKEVYDPPVEANEVLIVSAGSRGEYVGRIDLYFDADGNVASYEGRVQPLTEEIADDPEMRTWMAQSGMIAASALKPGDSGQFKP
jgi:2',3'-cyclic-nucleotide 2'-phosphodiesterase (5'-nucleotidase family)